MGVKAYNFTLVCHSSKHNQFIYDQAKLKFGVKHIALGKKNDESEQPVRYPNYAGE